MIKKQRIDPEGSLKAGVGSPPTTIVGGQRRRGLHQEAFIPVGIERALYLAATDAGFRTALLERRAEAARLAGLGLTETEASVLDQQEAASLEAAIDRLRPADRDRRQLLRVVAASFVSVAAGTASGGCVPHDVVTPQDAGGNLADVPVFHDVVTPLDGGGHLADVPVFSDVGPVPDAQPTLDASAPDAASSPPDSGVDGGR